MKSSIVSTMSLLDVSQNQLFYSGTFGNLCSERIKFFPIGNSPIIYPVNYSLIKQKYLLSAGVSHYTAYQFRSCSVLELYAALRPRTISHHVITAMHGDRTPKHDSVSKFVLFWKRKIAIAKVP